MSTRPQTRRLTVLIGDDDVAVRGSVVELVAPFGFRVLTAGCGAEALRQLLCEPVDFSILDFEMPDMTGVEVVQRYLAGAFIGGPSGPARHTPRRALPIIFMSANPERAVRAACESVGTTFLDKPISADRLQRAVGLLLQEHLRLT
ncbi:MAG: response regulator [Planctomycetes bacterium]|nr:response regulator [Planctomycetota bacterium]